MFFFFFVRGPIEYGSIWAIDGTLTDTTSQAESEAGNNNMKGFFTLPRSPSDAV